MPAFERFPEVDGLRGLGIALVVLFHFFFDLHFLGLAAFDPYQGVFLVLQRTAASLMILVAGISLSLVHSKARAQGRALRDWLPRRFLFLAGIAAFISLATWVYPHDGFIVFGILHFLALSTLLAAPFLSQSLFNVAFGLFFYFAGPLFLRLPLSAPWLLPLGFPPAGFYTLDYFPVLPWFGLVLVGLGLGNFFFPGHTRISPCTWRFPKGLEAAGRYSLQIYLAHQPVLFAALLAYKSLTGH